MVPVVHIVGTPPTASQASGAILHHTLGNGDFRAFANMYKEVTVSALDRNGIDNIEKLIFSFLLFTRSLKQI